MDVPNQPVSVDALLSGALLRRRLLVSEVPHFLVLRQIWAEFGQKVLQ